MQTETVPSPTAQDFSVESPPNRHLPAAKPEQPRATSQSFGNVVGAVAAVMSDIEAVEKGGKNTFHGYKYARMQDILQMLTPLMGKHGLAVFQTELSHEMFDDGKCLAIHYQFTIAHKSGEVWPERPIQTGMAPCRTSKGTYDDKAFAKCHTSARKYFLLSLFQVPTEDESDPDNEKGERPVTPVPGTDGVVPPHQIVGVRGETAKSWSNKYLRHIEAAKSLEELHEWDRLNNNQLSELQLKAVEIAAVVDKVFVAREAALAPKPETVPSAPKDATPRPAGIPDPEKDPDSYLRWADLRMARITTAAELDLIWEVEVDAHSDGLFKPDAEALQAMYEHHKKRLGAD
jgi:hypothetical protein